jgi:DNA invertase Pin-like site-specific DNA recombinase
LAEALSHLRAGDCLVVWKLDRLGRTLRGLIDFIAELSDRAIDFRTLNGTSQINTSSAQGRFFFHVMAALARPDPRAHQCGSCGSSRGRNGGRPPKVTARQLAWLLADPNPTMIEVAASLKIDRSTLYRALNREKRAGPAVWLLRPRPDPLRSFAYVHY